jgi:hypothetical protein
MDVWYCAYGYSVTPRRGLEGERTHSFYPVNGREKKAISPSTKLRIMKQILNSVLHGFFLKQQT